MSERSLLRKLWSLSALDSTNYVHFEGGLGAQILAYMLYQVRLENQEMVLPDTRYFDQVGVRQSQVSTLVQRQWALDYYGIPLRTLVGSNRPRYRMRLDTESQAKIDRQYLPAVSRRSWQDTFPLTSSSVEAVELITGGESSFGCIHVRQGDYLQVSSRVIGFQEVRGFLLRIEPLLPRRVLLVSDGDVPLGEIALLKRDVPSVDFQVVHEEDLYVVHALMRSAQLLITSNSTFSWTAGLLSTHRNAIRICPSNFFGFGTPELNSSFATSSDWAFLA
jgi:hypothetical protein